MKELKKTIVSFMAFVLSACSPTPPEPQEEPQAQSPETEETKKEEQQTEEPAPDPEQTEPPQPPQEEKKPNTIGSGKTPVMESYSARDTNLSLAVKAINGTVLKPGETFSFNDVVGVRSKEKGYKKATAFDANNNKVKEYGGGVCQISTTVYLAALNCGFPIVERHKHTREVPYEKNGNDATVSYGSADLKFKNDKGISVKIIASMDKSAVYIRIVEDI